MIYVNIHSGLGNQLFQYAFARNLSLKTGLGLKLYLGNLHKQELEYQRSIYRLDKFDIVGELAEESEVKPLIRREYSSRVFGIIGKLFGKQLRLYRNGKFQIDQNRYDKDKRKIGRSDLLYLNGYWAEEKYFIENAETIRNDFKLKGSLNLENQLCFEKISNCSSVGVHLRLTDYVDYSHVWNNLQNSYYQKGFDYINERVINPVYFVFSDEIDQAKKILKSLEESCQIHYININSFETDFMELMLMAACKHFIIANSTFSWWGAWLIPNREKIVLAPEKWFNNKQLQKEYQKSSLIPKSWIKI